MIAERGETSLARAFALMSGCAAVVVAAFVAAAFFGRYQPGARALLVGVAVAGSAAAIRDWRQGAGVTVFGALVFVGFLAHRDGVLTGDVSAWRYTALIALLAVLGGAARRACPVPADRSLDDAREAASLGPSRRG